LPELGISSFCDVEEADFLGIAEYELFETSRHTTEALLQAENIELVEITV